MKRLLSFSLAALIVVATAGCTTNSSGSYAYKSAVGSGSSQQQNGAQANSSNQSAQTSASSSWSSRSSISLGR